MRYETKVMEDNMIYFKRKMYERMLQWKKERDGATALLIQGARRIGKSTLAEEFRKHLWLDRQLNIW